MVKATSRVQEREFITRSGLHGKISNLNSISGTSTPRTAEGAVHGKMPTHSAEQNDSSGEGPQKAAATSQLIHGQHQLHREYSACQHAYLSTAHIGWLSAGQESSAQPLQLQVLCSGVASGHLVTLQTCSPGTLELQPDLLTVSWCAGPGCPEAL